MPSEASKRKAAEAAAKQSLAAARAEVDPARAKFLEDKVPPLVREGENAFAEHEHVSTDAELLNPDLTAPGASMAALEASFLADNATVELKQGEATVPTVVTAAAVEQMSDEEIKKAGLLKTSVAEQTVHPARLSPTSERPQGPLQKAPAAGPGTWPVPSDQLPAAMPADPLPDERQSPTDASFASQPGFSTTDTGELEVKRSNRASIGTSVVVPKAQVAAAANLWYVLKQQYPTLTHDELRDEFAVQLESMIGEPGSALPASEVSTAGPKSTGDPRTQDSNLGKLRADLVNDPNSLAKMVAEMIEKNDEAALRTQASALNLAIPADHDKPQIAEAILRKLAADDAK